MDCIYVLAGLPNKYVGYQIFGIYKNTNYTVKFERFILDYLKSLPNVTDVEVKDFYTGYNGKVYGKYTVKYHNPKFNRVVILDCKDIQPFE